MRPNEDIGSQYYYLYLYEHRGIAYTDAGRDSDICRTGYEP